MNLEGRFKGKFKGEVDRQFQVFFRDHSNNHPGNSGGNSRQLSMQCNSGRFQEIPVTFKEKPGDSGESKCISWNLRQAKEVTGAFRGMSGNSRKPPGQFQEHSGTLRGTEGGLTRWGSKK